MIINKKSWHYKAACMKSETHPSDSLCIYFWQVLGGILLFIMAVALMAGIAFIAVSPITMWFWNSIMPLGTLVIFSGVVTCIIYLLRKGVSVASDTTFVEVTSEWISAKKKRICPKLEFKD